MSEEEDLFEETFEKRLINFALPYKTRFFLFDGYLMEVKSNGKRKTRHIKAGTGKKQQRRAFNYSELL